jgi:hypothetical protein
VIACGHGLGVPVTCTVREDNGWGIARGPRSQRFCLLFRTATSTPGATTPRAGGPGRFSGPTCLRQCLPFETLAWPAVLSVGLVAESHVQRRNPTLLFQADEVIR